MAATSKKPAPYRKLYEDILKGINPSSDFVIRCGDQEFKVNKGFLFPRSEYFNTICNGHFREAEEGVLKLDDEEPVIVERIIEFIYCGYYTEPCPTTAEEGRSSKTPQDKYCDQCGPDAPCLACRRHRRSESSASSSLFSDEVAGWTPGFDTSGMAAALQHSIQDQLHAQANTEGTGPADGKGKDVAHPESSDTRELKMPNSVCNALVYLAADKFQMSDLMDFAATKFRRSFPQDFSEDLAGVVHIVFAGDYQPLQETVVEICLKHYDDLMDNERLENILSDCGQLAFKMLHKVKTGSELKAKTDKEMLEVSRLMAASQSSQLEHERGLRDAAQRKATRGTKHYWNALHLLNNNAKCRKCKEDFGAKFEIGSYKGEIPSHAVLNCRKCQTSHNR